MQTVLSIDVDYFGRPKVTMPEPGTRPEEARHHVRDLADVERFLRDRCLVTSERPTPGVAARDHDAEFAAIQQWMAGGGLRAPFRLVNVDAHADLGLGDPGYAEIVEDLLLRRPEDRATSLRHFGLSNWLAYVIANRWVSEVIFLREPDLGLDCEFLACVAVHGARMTAVQAWAPLPVADAGPIDRLAAVGGDHRSDRLGPDLFLVDDLHRPVAEHHQDFAPELAA